MMSRAIERAQRKVEENNFGIRKRLLEYDDVMNSQREVIYTQPVSYTHLPSTVRQVAPTALSTLFPACAG